MPRTNLPRGGHAPGHIRELFLALLGHGDPEVEVAYLVELIPAIGDTDPMEWARGKLWNCTDTVPSDVCFDEDVPAGSSYAQLVRARRR